MGYIGFPSDEYDLYSADIAPGLAALIVKDINGKPRSGILSPRPDLVVTSTGWNLQVRPFGAAREHGGGIMLAGSVGPVTVAVAPAPSSNSRIDVVYTLPPDMAAGEAPVPVLVASGNPAAVPIKPTIPAEAEELATFRVSAGASSASGGTITNTFRQTVTAGGVLPFRTTTERNSFAAVEGQLCRVGTELFQRSGSTWIPLVEKPRAGILVVDTGTLSVIGTTGNYGKTLTVNVPAVARCGEYLKVTALAVGTGYGILSQLSTSPGGSATSVSLRFIQINSPSSQRLTLLWKMVPTS